MKPLPTLKQLRYLVMLQREGHFGRAAERCFVTQSTLSAGIQELETLLEVSLAERTKRSVMLTPIGEQLAERAVEILRGAEDMVDLAAAVRGPLRGALRLGIIPTIGPFLLPGVLPTLREAHPELKLYLREDQTARLLNRLATGELDVVLLALPYKADGFFMQTLASDPFQLCCPPDHPLARQKLVAPDDLENEPLMLLEEGHCLRDHALSACTMANQTLVSGLEATSLQTLVHMVEGGLGLTLLPQMAIDAGLVRSLDVSLVPLKKGTFAREIGLGWRKNSGRSKEYELLGEFLASSNAPTH